MVIGLLVSSFRVGAAFGFSVSVLGSSCSRGFVFVFGAVGSIFLLVSFRLCELLQLLSVISACWCRLFVLARLLASQCRCRIGLAARFRFRFWVSFAYRSGLGDCVFCW